MRPVPITVIKADGEHMYQNWQPSEGERADLAEAGIHVGVLESIDDDGLYGVEMDEPVALVIASWGTPPGGWSLDQPAWADDQRGEGAIWLHLSTGTWVGVAPIDLEN